MQHGEHRIIFCEDAADGRRRISAQRLQFAKQEQPNHMVDICIEQD